MKLGKKGFTLVEVLVVVAIIGILSAMGVAGLQGAAENAKVDGVARMTVAFVERIGKESKRLGSPLCLKKASDQRIEVYRSSDCSDPSDDLLFDHMDIEAPMKFVSECPNLDDLCEASEGCDVNLLDGTHGVFKPRIGLASLPVSGFVCAQYGSEKQHFAVALKSKEENFVKPFSYDEDDGVGEWSW